MRQGQRIGIAGAGLMGRWHGYCAQRAGACVVAVADPDPDRATRLANRHGATAYANVDQMLAEAGVSILHVCAPSGEHLKIAQAAIANKVHLFVEKPLAADRAETTSLLDAAKAADLCVCPTHQYAFQRSMENILSCLDRAGEVLTVTLTFYSAGAQGRGEDEYAQIAADILPHPVSILQRLFPTADWRSAQWRLLPGPHGHWEYEACAGNIIVRIVLSLIARPTQASLSVVGAEGSFKANLFHDFLVWRPGQATRMTKITQPFVHSLTDLGAASYNMARRVVVREPAYPGLKTLMSRFYLACAGDAQPPISDDEILEIASIRDGFLSAAGGKATA